MADLAIDLEEKKAEAKQMLEIIADVSGSEGALLKTAILKSAFVLLLYNMIESTAFLVFERIHERIADQNYSELRTSIRKVWAEFFFTYHSADRHHGHLEQTLQQTLRFPLLEEFTDRVKLFSGNVDGRKINELMSKYEIGVLRAPNRERLKVIKDRRNSIAHGGEMFKEACRDLSDLDLQDLKIATFAALDDLVVQAQVYLTERRFLAGVPV